MNSETKQPAIKNFSASPALDKREIQELRVITDSIPALISYIDSHERIRRVNRAYAQFIGRDSVGLTVREAAGEEHYAVAQPYIQRALDGESMEFESRIRLADGSLRDITLSYTPDITADGVRGFVAMIQDITDRKRSETFVEGQNRVLKAIVEGADLPTLLGDICLLVEACTVTPSKASILLLDRDRKRLLFGAAPNLPETYNRAIHGASVDAELGTCARAAYFGREVITREIATDPFWLPFVQLTTEHNLRSCWSTPILDGTGAVLGTLALYYSTPTEPETADRPVVSTAARLAAVAIARKRAEDDLRTARDQGRVILESITDAFVALDSNWNFSYVNQEAERMLMRSREELIGRSIWVEFAPAVDTVFWYEYHRARREGVAVHFETLYPPLNTWFAVNAYPSADGLSVYFQDVTARKLAEGRDALLMRLDDATRGLTDAEEITQTAARLLGEHLGVNRCAYADVEPDEDTFNLTGDYNRDVESIIGRYTFAQFGADCLRLMRAGQPYVVTDSESDTRTTHALKAYRQTKIRSVICAPLTKSGRFVAAMAVHQVTPREWQQHEIEAVQLVASRCWESIERTRVTRELAAREQRLRLAQKVGRMGSFEWIIPENRVIWTPELEALYGVSEGTFEGKFEHWSARVVPEDAQQVITQIQSCVAAVQPELVYEFRAVLPDGCQRWLRGQSHFSYAEDGRPLNMIGVNIDIDVQKRAEDERKQLLAREQQARQTAEMLNGIGPILLSERDPQALAQRVTDLATQLVGAAFGSLFHNVLNEAGESYMLYTLSGVPRDAFSAFPMPRATHVFAPTFRGEGVVRSDDITKDPRYGKNAPYQGMPPGHLPVCSYLAAPVVSRSGEVLGGLFFGHSQPERFTEQHERLIVGVAAQAAIALDNARLFSTTARAKADLEASNERLRMANIDLEQFAFAAAHDLQEPLRMVTSYTQLLSRQFTGLDEKSEMYMSFVVSAAKRMSMLLQDLLAYTETSRESRTAPVLVDLNRVAQIAIVNVSTTINETHATIEVGELPSALGHEVHFIQLFQNLIGNALKYRQPGTAPWVRISATEQENEWVVCVKDNGQGIAPQFQQQIFGVFKRLHGKDIPGTGIGLAICHRVAERAGGRIWVESEGPGYGSSFCFALPKETYS